MRYNEVVLRVAHERIIAHGAEKYNELISVPVGATVLYACSRPDMVIGTQEIRVNDIVYYIGFKKEDLVTK